MNLQTHKKVKKEQDFAKISKDLKKSSKKDEKKYNTITKEIFIDI
jgi:hypothetical protein